MIRPCHECGSVLCVCLPDDQAQKPFGDTYPGIPDGKVPVDGWDTKPYHSKSEMRRIEHMKESKPDASPREWWLYLDDIRSIGISEARRKSMEIAKRVHYYNPHNSIWEPRLEVHVIEKSAFLLENQKRNKAVELCSKMEAERDALSARVTGLIPEAYRVYREANKGGAEDETNY